MQESNAVLVQHGGVPFFEAVQKKYNIEHPISCPKKLLAARAEGSYIESCLNFTAVRSSYTVE
jgi:hypothetical protein